MPLAEAQKAVETRLNGESARWTIGYVSPEKRHAVPTKNMPEHEFCFYLHDMMGQLLREVESLNIRSASFELSVEGQQAAAQGSESLIDYLLSSKDRPQTTRLFLNHVLVALTADYLHFVYEGLIALAKRKFAVAMALLRKPFKEDLFHISWMLGDASDYWLKFEESPSILMESRRTDSALRASIMKKALENCVLAEAFDPTLIERIIYDKNEPNGLAGLFDQATHLVTSSRSIRTEPMNLNFIFKNPLDNDIFESVYSAIAMVLMYTFALLCSELEKVTPIDTAYVRRRLLVAFMVYQALFSKGRPTLYRSIEKDLGDLFKCTVCKELLKARKIDIPRLLVTERIICRTCRSDSLHAGAAEAATARPREGPVRVVPEGWPTPAHIAAGNVPS